MKKIIFALLFAVALLLPKTVQAQEVQGVQSFNDLYVNDVKMDVKGYVFEGYNYYRLRDLAQILQGKMDFNAAGNAKEITITKRVPYVTAGNDRGPNTPTAKGTPVKLTIRCVEGDEVQYFEKIAYTIGGFHYFKLRDMAEIIGFDVDYSYEKNAAHIYAKNESNHLKEQRVILGSERLFTDYKHLIDGKRVGLITNQTAIDGDGIATLTKLIGYENTELVAAYAPEHGIDGKRPAGKYVESYFDKNRNIPIYSLYGKTRKPTKKMLKGVDVLIYELQDIGARTYTYISTLNYAMIAAKENNIPIVVLDRPNPLGGEIVEGFMLEPKFKSFVGVDEMPMAHGMTVGEMAQYFNRKIGANLTVVPMEHWRRNMTWDETHLRFVQTSPMIPTLNSAKSYMATGSGEQTGIGMNDYFAWVGGKNLNAKAYAKALNAKNLPGVQFLPMTKGDRGGVRVRITDPHVFNPARVGIYTIATANQMRPVNVPASTKPYGMFYLIQGNEKMAQLLRRQASPEEIVEAYQGDVARFKEIRKPYLIYE